jgi:hypothetical protein
VVCVHEGAQCSDEQLFVDLALGGVEVRAEHDGRGEQVAPGGGAGLEDGVAITDWGVGASCGDWGRLGRSPGGLGRPRRYVRPGGGVKAGYTTVRSCTGLDADPVTRPCSKHRPIGRG